MAIPCLFLPNCLVVVTTVYLLVIAKQVARRGGDSLKWQGIMTTTLTATVYCISILPYVVYCVRESIVTAEDKSARFFHGAFRRMALSFLYLNTISNFYIYGLSVDSFRDFVSTKMRQTYRMITRTGISARHGKGIVLKFDNS